MLLNVSVNCSVSTTAEKPLYLSIKLLFVLEKKDVLEWNVLFDNASEFLSAMQIFLIAN